MDNKQKIGGMVVKEEDKPKKEDIYYELMPHKAVKNIKKEIENLKKKAESESFSSKSVMTSINNLTQSIDSLMSLFKEATEGMKLEEQAEEEVSKKITPLISRIDELEEQNRKIAQGIVTIADMVSELKEQIEKKSAEHHMRQIPRPKIVIPPQPHQEMPKQMPPPGINPRAPPIFPPPGQMLSPFPKPEERAMPWERASMPPPMPEMSSFGPSPFEEQPLPEPPSPEARKKGLLGGLFKK